MVWRVTNEPVDCRPSRGTTTQQQLDDNWTTTQQQLPIATVHMLTTPLIT